MSSDSQIRRLVEIYGEPLRKHWLVWVVPTILVTALAIGFGFMSPKTWLASQQLVVRNETLGTPDGFGKFQSYDEMKTVEETIHAVAKNRQLAREVLAEVGPPANYKEKNKWPTERDVDSFLGCVSITAPNGAVFGQTEVIQLNVKADSPARSKQLTNLVTDGLAIRLNKLRENRSASLESELSQAVEMAQARLRDSTIKLSEIEQGLGTDLSELRTLDQQFSGGAGILQQELGRVREAIRTANRELSSIALHREYLESVRKDPEEIVMVPGSLLIAYPALGRLKNGLVDAELRLAKSLGQYDQTHPKSARIIEEVDQIQRRLREELDIALTESDFDHQKVTQKIDQLQQTYDELETRISRFTVLRVDYNRLVSEVEQRKKDVATASSQLAGIQSTRHSAQHSSIIGKIGEPVVSTDPLGPGTKMLGAGGLVCGLAIGIGLVFLLTPVTQDPVLRDHHGATADLELTPLDVDVMSQGNLMKRQPVPASQRERRTVRPTRARPTAGQLRESDIHFASESSVSDEELIDIDLLDEVHVGQPVQSASTVRPQRSESGQASRSDHYLLPNGDGEVLIKELDELRSDMRSG